MAWEQGAWELVGDPTHHALCSEAGSQPCLCWITQRISLTRLTARGHFTSWGSFHTGEPLFYVFLSFEQQQEWLTGNILGY